MSTIDLLTKDALALAEKSARAGIAQAVAHLASSGHEAAAQLLMQVVDALAQTAAASVVRVEVSAPGVVFVDERTS